MNNIIAIRSLASPHHATHIEPTVFSVTWDLGKRCNYDCSYCSPTVHDWTSPHMPLDTAKEFLAKVDAWAIDNQRTVKWSFTGGEPYLNPEIIDILSAVRDTKSCDDMIAVITNGSMPLELYQESMASVTNLTISLHFDRTPKEIEKTLEKIIVLNTANPDRFITVQVMMYPGKFDYISTVVKQLEANNVKHVYRRIRPFTDDLYSDLFGDQDKRTVLKTKVNADTHHQQRGELKSYLHNNLLRIYDSGEYYTEQELIWLKTNIPEVRWQNIGVWDKDKNYSEINSDELVSNNLHQFKDWTCYVGVDSAYIDSTGDIYRGSCTNGGSIGSVGDFVGFCTVPTVCGYKLCISNQDLIIRKSASGHEKLITN